MNPGFELTGEADEKGKAEKLMFKAKVLVGIAVGILIVCVIIVATAGGGGGAMYAIAKINPDANSGVKGSVKLTHDGGKIKIVAHITGLTAGLHGFHIHTLGDLSNGCKSTGGHYNPKGREHGGPDMDERHDGDLGSITADASGMAHLEVEDRMVTLHGPRSVIGRAFVVHAGADDLGQGGDAGSKATGNAGGRLACGIIGISDKHA